MGCTCSTQTQDSLGIRVNQSTRSSSHHVLVAAGHISEAKGNDRNPDHKYRALVLVCRPVRSLANSTSGNFVLRQQWNMHWGLQVANSYPQDGYIWDLTVENGQILTCGRVWPEHREGIKDDRIIKENVEVASNLSDVEIQTIGEHCYTLQRRAQQSIVHSIPFSSSKAQMKSVNTNI